MKWIVFFFLREKVKERYKLAIDRQAETIEFDKIRKKKEVATSIRDSMG
jgi:hypothetical protein